MELLDNLSLLKSPSTNLQEITVLGLKIGLTLDELPEEFSNIKPYGGWFHIQEGVAFFSDSPNEKSITGFLLRSQKLENLKLNREEYITEIFGTPNAIEKRRGTAYYFYNELNIVVGWNYRDKELFGIYIGETSLKQTEYSTIDLILKFYEFKAYVPNRSEWNAESLKFNQPRYFRYLEILSLMKAFKVGSNIQEDFEHLGFLQKRTKEDFTLLIKDIEDYASHSEHEKQRWERDSQSSSLIKKLGFTVSKLFRFSEEFRSLLDFNSGVMEAGQITSRYAITRTKRILENIDLTELHEIEGILCSLINPENKTFTQNELVTHYDFPQVDLAEIDSDNY
ncbi:hypothetical protein BFP72_10285 [Reichenbachiella sp. 5M10]|uniref:hypothetical protein n=1 Tax=Reichenbachiella sp. 5M10 TaxID=1889772 RepID=UPI000C15E68E|nr:hypothetical protein [Reichenbachiella sp. 5M10]PIB35753.1 hypothetical protein BFP72_10285 [Reichenbachiella sp. 5M10]